MSKKQQRLEFETWLQNLFLVQTNDFKEVMRAVQRELLPRWRALHSRKNPGPRPLDGYDVCEANVVLESHGV